MRVKGRIRARLLRCFLCSRTRSRSPGTMQPQDPPSPPGPDPEPGTPRAYFSGKARVSFRHQLDAPLEVAG
ncbi:hypothetical protein Y1Q_0023937 [Alligator mississippiensis]|uniref:Uncharacterized protein n=1 Tax=Alligator mississippiensis TaxID=8496 RepID=A0A151NTX6_ALLMI|nr:hypothetical protein Y1Q_0023937 [Alligator mississippiensis]